MTNQKLWWLKFRRKRTFLTEKHGRENLTFFCLVLAMPLDLAMSGDFLIYAEKTEEVKKKKILVVFTIYFPPRKKRSKKKKKICFFVTKISWLNVINKHMRVLSRKRAKRAIIGWCAQSKILNSGFYERIRIWMCLIILLFCLYRGVLDSLLFDPHICWGPVVSSGNVPRSVHVHRWSRSVETGPYVQR